LKELQRRQEEDERRRQPHKGPSPSRIAGERIETTFPAEGGIRTETTLGEGIYVDGGGFVSHCFLID
jgi:hypothetical protein